MAPKHSSSDAGNSDMPQKSYKELPLCENVCVHTYTHIVYVGFGAIRSVRHLLGILEHILAGKRTLPCIIAQMLPVVP